MKNTYLERTALLSLLDEHVRSGTIGGLLELKALFKGSEFGHLENEVFGSATTQALLDRDYGMQEAVSMSFLANEVRKHLSEDVWPLAVGNVIRGLSEECEYTGISRSELYEHLKGSCRTIDVGRITPEWVKDFLRKAAERVIPLHIVSSVPKSLSERILAEILGEKLKLNGGVFGGDVAIERLYPFKPAGKVWIETIKEFPTNPMPKLWLLVEANEKSALYALRRLREAGHEAVAIVVTGGRSMSDITGNLDRLILRYRELEWAASKIYVCHLAEEENRQIFGLLA